MDEIKALQMLASDVEKKDATKSNLELRNSLCRGGIVLLCSHIEGYVEDLISLALNRLATSQVQKNTFPPVLKFHLSRDLIVDINSSTDPETIASKVEAFVSRDAHIWDSSLYFSAPLHIDNFVGRFATPTHSNISAFFRRFGYDTFPGELAAELKANFPACTNMVDQVVHQRNKIAHGDIFAYGTPADLKLMGSFVRLYCRYTDLVVGNWFRSKSCSIR